MLLRMGHKQLTKKLRRMIISMLFIIFFLIVMILLFLLAFLLKGVTSVAEIWRRIIGRRNSGNSSGTGNPARKDEPDQVIGGSSRTDLSSVKDVEFEKEEQ